MMYKTPTFAEPQQYNVQTFFFGSVISFHHSIWKLASCYPAVKEKNRKSCNKNSMKNTEMLEKYIFNIYIHSNIPVFFIEFLLQLFLIFFSLRDSNWPVSILNDES